MQHRYAKIVPIKKEQGGRDIPRLPVQDEVKGENYPISCIAICGRELAWESMATAA